MKESWSENWKDIVKMHDIRTQQCNCSSWKLNEVDNEPITIDQWYRVVYQWFVSGGGNHADMNTTTQSQYVVTVHNHCTINQSINQSIRSLRQLSYMFWNNSNPLQLQPRNKTKLYRVTVIQWSSFSKVILRRFWCSFLLTWSNKMEPKYLKVKIISLRELKSLLLKLSVFKLTKSFLLC